MLSCKYKNEYEAKFLTMMLLKFSKFVGIYVNDFCVCLFLLHIIIT